MLSSMIVLFASLLNRGFLMNILDGKPKVVKCATIVSGIGILIWDILAFLPVRITRTVRADGKAGGIRLCIRRGSYLRQFGMTLLSAGAASNIFDRLVRGKVIDYIGIRTGQRHLDRITANLGDCFIACGGLILMLRDFILIPGRRTP